MSENRFARFVELLTYKLIMLRKNMEKHKQYIANAYEKRHRKHYEDTVFNIP